ncbi:MAG: ATP-binding protein [Chloroflexota bacterium]
MVSPTPTQSPVRPAAARQDKLAQRAAQLTLINEIGKQIVSVLALDTLLDKAARLIQKHFNYHHVGLFTIDHEARELVMCAIAGDLADRYPPNHRLKFNQGMVGWVGEHGKKLHAPDVSTEPHYVNLYPEVIDSRSELAVPLKMGKKILGVLDVQSPQCNAFDDNDLLVIETLADQIAIAIENARLYEAIQRELEERERIEQYIIRTERLAAMGRITATLAHEIKNPLQAIRSHLDLVLDFPLSTEERQSSLHICSQEVDRLTEIIERTLSFVRPGEERTAAPSQLPKLLVRALNLASKSLEHANIQVKNYVDELPAVRVQADQITQVLLNLLINSVEAMPIGGRIDIRAEATQDMVTMTFCNDGPPIPDEHIEHIFDPFFTTKPTNTGLGLYVSYLIVEQHGGNICVENMTAKQGVRFTIQLPIAHQLTEKETTSP